MSSSVLDAATLLPLVCVYANDDAIDALTSVTLGFLTMSRLRRELFLNHCLLLYMRAAGPVSPLEAMYWFVELVRSFVS